MGASFHHHHGGNHPHVHHHTGEHGLHPRAHDADTEHVHGHRDYNHESDHSHTHPPRHGVHVYDATGNQPAVVQSHAGELGHWHFDIAFEHIALTPAFDLTVALIAAPTKFERRHAKVEPQAPRPPPSS